VPLIILGAVVCLSNRLCPAQNPDTPAPAVPDVKKAEDSSDSVAASPAKTESNDPWEVLSSGVNNRNSIRRAEALAALGTIPPRGRVVRLVESRLDDKDPSIRGLAARVLGEMRARSAIPSLTKALNDPSAEVTFAAAKSLWTMGDRAGREVFIAILAGEKSSGGGPGGLIKDQLQSTRRKLDDPKGLAVIGAKEAATSLFGPASWGIKVMEELTQDRFASARAMSAILLGPDATLDSLRQLQDALNDKNWIVRAAAAQGLGTCRRRDQVRYLQPLLLDDKPAVRYLAAASILRLSSGRSAATPPGTPSTAELQPAFNPVAPKSFK